MNGSVGKRKLGPVLFRRPQAKSPRNIERQEGMSAQSQRSESKANGAAEEPEKFFYSSLRIRFSRLQFSVEIFRESDRWKKKFDFLKYINFEIFPPLFLSLSLSLFGIRKTKFSYLLSNAIGLSGINQSLDRLTYQNLFIL